MRYIIRNTYHNTEATVRTATLSTRTAQRVRRELCCLSDCRCGGILSERADGIDCAIRDEHGARYWATGQNDGSVTLTKVD